MNNALKNKMQLMIELGKKHGADASDVILSKGESFSLSAQNSQINTYKVSGSQVIGIRAIKDDKIGISYTESLDDASLETAVKAAVENAKNSEVSDHEKICIATDDNIYPSEFTKDDTSTTDKIDFTLSLESEVKKRDSRVQAVPYNGFSEVDSQSYYMNSLGTFCFSSQYYQSCYTSALLHEGDKNAMHYHSSLARNMKGLDRESCIAESLLHAGEWINAMPLATGYYDLIFTTDAMNELFGCFDNIYSAKGAMEKTNPFADLLGKQVAGRGVTVRDIPKYKDAFSKYYTDSEGALQKDLTLIENGNLNSFYHNTATASFFKTTTTGHASRGAKGVLGVSGTTRVISTGKTSQSDITSGKYFEVHALQGLHSGANAISGEFSFAATGYLCRDGKRIQPVKGVTVSGNFHKLLLDINIIGDTMYSTNSKSFFSPMLRFESMSIAGK